MTNALRKFDITLGEYEVLSILKQGPLRQSAIYERTKQSVPSVSRRLKRFEIECWVDRQCAPKDRRRLDVFLTERGRKQIVAANRGLAQAVSQPLSVLGASELETLCSLYGRIEALLSAGEASRKE